MSEQEMVVAVVALACGTAMLFGLGSLILKWLTARGEGGVGAPDVTQLQRQIGQLQTSVDAMAIELERISEGQRFTTRLLAERPEAARLERGGDR